MNRELMLKIWFLILTASTGVGFGNGEVPIKLFMVGSGLAGVVLPLAIGSAPQWFKDSELRKKANEMALDSFPDEKKRYYGN
jgi:hypothetical protein